MHSCHMLQFDGTDAVHLGHHKHGENWTACVGAQMAGVGSLDFFKLPTISEDTRKFITRDKFPF